MSASSTPSPSGEITLGETASPESSGGAGGGGGTAAAAAPVPIVPLAGRVSGPASIVHVYEARAATGEVHVHEMVAPAPWPAATAFPPALRTVTAHGGGRREPRGEDDRRRRARP